MVVVTRACARACLLSTQLPCVLAQHTSAVHHCCLQVNILHRRRPQLLVATPGRLLDLLDSGIVAFDHTSSVVLDEADKMLSVGFEPQLQRLKALLLDSKAAAVSTEPSRKKSKKQKQQQQEPAAAAAGAGQQCQVLLFSATLPKAVRQTADVWLKPGYKSVSCSAGADSISNTITQVSLFDGLVVVGVCSASTCTTYNIAEV